MSTDSPQIRLHLTAPREAAFAVAEALDPVFEDEALTTTLFERQPFDGSWSYGVYAPATEEDRLRAIFATEPAAADHALDCERLEETDWVSHTLRDLAPVHAGRFTVHGSHDRNARDHRPVRVEVDAGLAFGTGHHGTTTGCLMMLERCLREQSPRHRKLRRALDVGTGSGVLAIALAKAARIPVLATDIDPVAVAVARENCRDNAVAAHVRCETAADFQHPAFARFGPVDLVFANILSGPLQALAGPMQAHLAPGAQVILSGLLPHQQARLVARYRAHGLRLRRALVHDGWLTLLMERP